MKEQYINKAAVMAEIDRRIQFFTEESRNSNSDIVIALFGLKSFLNTLEVKEVDLEKEINKWIEDNTCRGYCSADICETAEHFFELGLKVQIEE
jgi:hypothetical protein